MEIKLTDSTNHRPAGSRIVDAPLVNIDLGLFSKQIMHEETWKSSGHNAITVFKTDGLRIVLIAMHKEAELKNHLVAGIISVHVLEGKILFTTEHQSVEVHKGQIIALHENISHAMLAKEETIILLTITSMSWQHK